MGAVRRLEYSLVDGGCEVIKAKLFLIGGEWNEQENATATKHQDLWPTYVELETSAACTISNIPISAHLSTSGGAIVGIFIKFTERLAPIIVAS